MRLFPHRTRLTGATIAGTLLLSLLPFTGAASAAARMPVPQTREFSAAIDDRPVWEPESGCSAVAKPGVSTVRDLLRATYDSAIASNIVRACSARDSGHEEGRSIDWMTNVRVPEQAAAANAFLKWLLATDEHGNAHAMARRMGVAYVIWNGRMWRNYDPARGWTEYSRCLQPERRGTSYDNTCHRNHVHMSFSWEGAYAYTSFYTGRVRVPCATPVTSARLTRSLGANMRAVPVAPRRLLDTRTGAASCRLGPRQRYDLKVTGVGGVPSTGVGAVALNITALNPSGNTYVSAYPAGTSFPGTAVVNVAAARSAAALAVVPVGVNGKISLLNGPRAVDLAVDVSGYYATDGSGVTHTTVTPRRAFDSRKTSALRAREKRTITLAAKYGVPRTATGVLVNITAFRAARRGYLAAGPSITTTPGASTVNYVPNDTVANRAMVKLSRSGSIDIYSSAATEVLVDVVGWFGSGGSRLTYTPVRSRRILDTRTGTGGLDTLVGGRPKSLAVAGVAGVPTDAKGVVATLTLTRPTKATRGIAWPTGATPGTSDVNVSAGVTRGNLVSTAIASRAVKLAIGSGTADALVDVAGYYR